MKRNNKSFIIVLSCIVISFLVILILSQHIKAKENAQPEVLEYKVVPVKQETYIGTSRDVKRQLVAYDVKRSDIEIFNEVVYITYARSNTTKFKIYIRKYFLSNHSLSPAYHIVDYEAPDHFSLSAAIDGDGYIHIVWGRFKDKETYVRSLDPEDITRWTKEELIADADATYTNAIAYGDTFYNLYRDGDHGQGWKLIWKSRNESNWSQVKIVDGDLRDAKHTYIKEENQWLFDNPESQYLAFYWVYDDALDGQGERRYQRITHYNLSARRHYHLDGRVIGFGDGSKIPHEGPLDYYGQSGDFISDDHSPKFYSTTGNGRGDRIHKLHLGVQRTGKNIVVLSSYGVNTTRQYFLHGLQASIWNETVWTRFLLEFPFNGSIGDYYPGNVRGFNNETLWLVQRRPFDPQDNEGKSDITILRNSEDGWNWSFEHFTDDDFVYQSNPEAVYSRENRQYIITWREGGDSHSLRNLLYIGYKKITHD